MYNNPVMMDCGYYYVDNHGIFRHIPPDNPKTKVCNEKPKTNQEHISKLGENHVKEEDELY